MNKKIDFKLSIADNQIKIYLNDTLHLCLKQDELIGIQSWVKGDTHQSYWIEYTLKDREILTGYDCIEKWKEVLKLLDSNNLFPTL